jgi:GH24 family phage-related lysozyme (muramidase)
VAGGKGLAAALGVAATAATPAAPAAPTAPDADLVTFIADQEGGEQHRTADGIWHPYADEAGKWTIGRGHLINGGKNARGFERGLTDAEVEALFVEDVAAAQAQARAVVGARFDGLDPKMQGLLTDFSFNLGPKFAEEFPTMLGHVMAGDMEGAARESARFLTTPAGEKKPLKKRNADTLRFFFGKE